MNRKDAFKRVRKSKSILDFISNRQSKIRWIENYGANEFKALRKLGYLIPSNPYVDLGESYYTEYYMFTKKGILWRDWYQSKWEFIKMHIFRWYDIRIWYRHTYENIRYKLTGKQPAWWEYKDTNLNNI